MSPAQLLGWLPLVIGVVAAMIVFFGSFFTVEQQFLAIIERFGKFHRVAAEGLRMKLPLIDRVAEYMTLKLQQLEVVVETKTKDNTSVKVGVAVQNRVIREKVREAYYELEDEDEQMTAYICDVVRSKVPTMDVDEVFERKDDLAAAIKKELSEKMGGYGFLIVDSLVTSVTPDDTVKQAMNEIVAAQRERVAATERGEADKILRVKQAEAEKETKRLQGEGVALQRQAIAEGLKKSVDELKSTGVDAAEARRTLLMVQFFDTLRDVAQHSGTRVLFLPYTPGGLADLERQMLAALEAEGKGGDPPNPDTFGVSKRRGILGS